MSLPSPRGERERERSRGTAFEACGLQSAHAAPSRPDQQFRATAQRSQAPSRLQQRFRATVHRFRAPHPPPADPFGANTIQNPICGQSNAEMEPTYNINDRLRHMGRRLPTYPRRPFWSQSKTKSDLWEIESSTQTIIYYEETSRDAYDPGGIGPG